MELTQPPEPSIRMISNSLCARDRLRFEQRYITDERKRRIGPFHSI